MSTGASNSSKLERIHKVGFLHVSKPGTLRWIIPNYAKWIEKAQHMTSPIVVVFGKRIHMKLRAREQSNVLCLSVYYPYEDSKLTVCFSAVSESENEYFHLKRSNLGPLSGGDQDNWTTTSELLEHEDLNRSENLLLKCVLSPGVLVHNPWKDVHLYKLADDIREVFANEKYCDYIIKVQGTDIPVHRCILHSRIKSFPLVDGGIYDISQFEVETVRELMMYVYAGRIEYLHSGNVLEMYKIATEYKINEVKQQCAEIFHSNAEFIIRSDQWHDFFLSDREHADNLNLMAMNKRTVFQ